MSLLVITLTTITKNDRKAGAGMRDYTYIEGYRFIIWNIYRSKRFRCLVAGRGFEPMTFEPYPGLVYFTSSNY